MCSIAQDGISSGSVPFEVRGTSGEGARENAPNATSCGGPSYPWFVRWLVGESLRVESPTKLPWQLEKCNMNFLGTEEFGGKPLHLRTLYVFAFAFSFTCPSAISTEYSTPSQ